MQFDLVSDGKADGNIKILITILRRAYEGPEFQRALEEMVVSRVSSILAEEVMREHGPAVLASIDAKAISNIIVMREAADAIRAAALGGGRK